MNYISNPFIYYEQYFDNGVATEIKLWKDIINYPCY